MALTGASQRAAEPSLSGRASELSPTSERTLDGCQSSQQSMEEGSQLNEGSQYGPCGSSRQECAEGSATAAAGNRLAESIEPVADAVSAARVEPSHGDVDPGAATRSQGW